jgi:hypothetical protein
MDVPGSNMMPIGLEKRIRIIATKNKGVRWTTLGQCKRVAIAWDQNLEQKGL